MSRINPANASIEVVQAYRVKFLDKVDREAKNALEAHLKSLLKTAIAITPKDTGALRDSGRYEVEQWPNGPRGHVSFGGINYKVSPTVNAPAGFVTYAVQIHEAPPNVAWSTPGTGEKFLERAVKLTSRSLRDRLIKALKKVTA